MMPVLKREQSEEQMAVGGGGHGEAPVHGVIPGTTGHGHGAPVARGASQREYYRMVVGPSIPAGQSS